MRTLEMLASEHLGKHGEWVKPARAPRLLRHNYLHLRIPSKTDTSSVHRLRRAELDSRLWGGGPTPRRHAHVPATE